MHGKATRLAMADYLAFLLFSGEIHLVASTSDGVPMRIPCFIVTLFLFLGGCSSAFRTATVDPVKTFREETIRLLNDSLFIPSNAAVKIVSLQTGEVLYSRNSKLLMRPASNTKLLTSAAALHVLGTQYEFRTTLECDSLDEATGTCYTLYLRGGGDPDLTDAQLDSLARQLKSLGIQRVDGDVIADASFFDSEYWGPGWMWDDEADPDGMPVSAISVNKNCVRVTARPDSATARFVQVTVEPPTNYVSVSNCAVISTDTLLPRLTIKRLFKERMNTILVEGAMRPWDRPRSVRTTVWQPELYAATLLRESCERVGIGISGMVRFGAGPTNGRVLATHIQPIDSMIVNLNKISDNLSAENSLKTLAATVYGVPGSFSSGLSVVHQTLAKLNIDTTAYRFVDGSGLSHYNLISAEAIIQLLQGMYASPGVFPLYYASLPIAGVDGTLARRMRGTPAEGNLRAKTGTIAGVSSLSGYVRTRDDELLAFSILMQNFITPSDRYRAIQDSLGSLMASFSRHQRIAERSTDAH